MDRIPSFDLLDLVIAVLHSSSKQPKKSKENVQGNLPHDTLSRKHTKNQVKTLQFSTTIWNYATSILFPQT